MPRAMAKAADVPVRKETKTVAAETIRAVTAGSSVSENGTAARVD